jgi:predicted transcriptional regulator
MSVPCEVALKCVLPVIRAMIARELMDKYGLKQVEVAKLLGVSQPAISLYCRSIRGRAIDLENDSEIKRLVTDTAELLVNNLSRRDLIVAYCEMCKLIRGKGLICKLHKAIDPLVDIEKCELCVASASV